jgi:hypothetical protein
MSAPPTIVEALDDPALLGAAFPDPSSWGAWRAFLAALFGLPLDPGQLDFFQRCTGRESAPSQEVGEAAAIVGRRGGKTTAAALIATYLAVFRDWRPYLTPGERAHVVVISQSLKTARVPLGHIRSYFQAVPLLRQEVVAERAEELDLRNGVTIGTWPCTYRSTRGLTIAAAVLDEVDYWWQESVNAAEEVVASVRPGMMTLPGSKLIAISSPYTPTGWLYRFFQQHWGRDEGALIWRAPSLAMNPTLSKARIEAAVVADPERGRAEWEAEWRAGICAFLDPALLDACVRRDPVVIPPRGGLRYAAGVDPSGGGPDEFTWSIAHKEEERVVVDLVAARGGRGRSGFDLDSTVRQCAEDLKRYGLNECIGDKYAASWVIEAFRRYGIRYTHSESSKAAYYLSLLPFVTTSRLEIPGDAELVKQAKLLERRQGAVGKDTVDHPRGGRDDRINAVALAARVALARPALLGFPSPTPPPPGVGWKTGSQWSR